MNDNQRMIQNALSLRAPQAESLDLLARVCEKMPLDNDFSTDEALQVIRELAPSVKNFERSFSSICFAIATGVGKTRLMGAFIAYLYLEKGIRNFFVIAPNLTIYNKLITDFTPNTPKYVFPGIPDFAINPPQIITGDNYDQIGGLLDKLNDGKIRINIFNISKIDSDKDSATGTPRIRRMAEYLGQSYFDYLASLQDLVILMDEAHRYRAKAGMAAINELNPVLGIELTATAKETGAKGKPFQNIIYEYNLAYAIHDGYVKKPAIVGRTNFDKNVYSFEELETLKIKDGLTIHESLKAELAVYADHKKTRLVKPFMLIVADNIQHAEELTHKIDSDDFEDGKYKGKVLEVDSSKSGEIKDDMLEKLLSVEQSDNPIEIVVHVNMLGEGWDVNNLYTIVPLRAANSKILVEQSIGRGLRLPFGELTGNEALDRLHIIAHDKFAEIVDAARDKKFDFQQEYVDSGEDMKGKVAIENKSILEKDLESQSIPVKNTNNKPMEQTKMPVFSNEQNKQILIKTQEAIEELSEVMSSSKDLLKPENQERLKDEVQKKITEDNLKSSELSLEPQIDIREAVKLVTEKFVNFNLDIPRIKIIHQMKPQTGSTFEDFDLNLKDFEDMGIVPENLRIQELESGNIKEIETKRLSQNPQERLLVSLMDKQEINYTFDSELLGKLTEEAITFIKSYTKEENQLEVLLSNIEKISYLIYLQMMKHLHIPETETITKVNGGYATLTTHKILMLENQEPVNYRASVDKIKIKSYVFEDFKKCLFEKQKFDSSTEKDLAELLEKEADVIKWFKINDEKAKEIFDMRYSDSEHNLHYYCPDFIVETNDCKYIIETKAEEKMDDKTVRAKAEVAKNWCKIAGDFELKNAGKAWKYLLVPHTTIIPGRTLARLVADFEVK